MNARTLLVLTLVAAPAVADELAHTVSFQTPLLTAQSPTWQASLSFPRFDPDLGYLQSVSVELTGTMTGFLGVENVSASETSSLTHVRAHISSASHAGQVYTTPWFLDLQNAPTLAAFDG